MTRNKIYTVFVFKKIFNYFDQTELNEVDLSNKNVSIAMNMQPLRSCYPKQRNKTQN